MTRAWRAAATAVTMLLPLAAAADYDVGPNTNAAYASECGSCHFAYQPGLLPARSWRSIMSNLHDHFGDNAEVQVKARQAIQDYLVAHAADVSDNQRSRAVMESLDATDVPLRVTTSPYIAGVHGGLLEPLRGGQPRMESLGDCNACHLTALEGAFRARRYTVSDEAFRATRSVR
jgi:hypothetical protein